MSERDPLIPNNPKVKPRAFGKPQPIEETEETKNLGDDQLLYQQQEHLRAQDRTLDAIGESVQRTKEIAIAIGNETDQHIKILDDLDTKVEKTNAKIKNTTKRVELVQIKASDKCMWVVICILLLSLIGIGVAAYYT